jgi:hypothetical protein
MIPSRKEFRFHGFLPPDFNTSMYGIAAMLHRLLHNIQPQSGFVARLESLLHAYPEIDPQKMGFAPDWRENPAWKHQVA